MRIRFVTLYFPPEIGAAQRRISELARRLGKMGHEVTIVTGFPNYPSGIKPVGYRGHLAMKEKLEDYTVIRLPHYIAPNRGFLRRVLMHLTFAFSAAVYTIFARRDDIAYVESPPLFNGFVGLVSKWLRGIPYYFNVADLWPQTAIELGALNNRPAIKIAQFLEQLFYKKAAKILAVTSGIQKFIINLGFDESKVPLVTNGVDPELFSTDVTPDPEVSSLKQGGNLLAMYAGTHGMAHALHVILEVADKLRDENIRFLFLGDGAEKEKLLELAERLKLNNVIFRDYLPQSRMPEVWGAADIAVIPLRDLPLFDSAMPSKCFEAMAAGVPIMLAVRGEMAAHIEKAGCGYTVEPENVPQMVEAFKKLSAADQEQLKAMGAKGRIYVREHFARDKIAGRLIEMMRETVGHD